MSVPDRTTTYLGDGVYARFANGMVHIWTSNGMTKSAEIALDPDVMSSLLQYHDRCHNPPAKPVNGG